MRFHPDYLKSLYANREHGFIAREWIDGYKNKTGLLKEKEDGEEEKEKKNKKEKKPNPPKHDDEAADETQESEREAADETQESERESPDETKEASNKAQSIHGKGNKAQARWIQHLGVAEQSLWKGRKGNSFGIIRDGKIVYFLEEALYLREEGWLQIVDDNYKELSLYDLYSFTTKETCGCNWNKFQIYKHLTRLGYVLRRYEIPDDSICGEAANDMLLFNVYEPNEPSPSFVACYSGENPPTPGETKTLEHRASLPLLFCQVLAQGVIIFQVSSVQLPLLPR